MYIVVVIYYIYFLKNSQEYSHHQYVYLYGNIFVSIIDMMMMTISTTTIPM